MDEQEARNLLTQEMTRLWQQDFQSLAKLIGSPQAFERVGESGAAYQIEVEAMWDDPKHPDGDLRVLATIDDGGLLTAFNPISDDFIVSPPEKNNDG